MLCLEKLNQLSSKDLLQEGFKGSRDAAYQVEGPRSKCTGSAWLPPGMGASLHIPALEQSSGSFFKNHPHLTSTGDLFSAEPVVDLHCALDAVRRCRGDIKERERDMEKKKKIMSWSDTVKVAGQRWLLCSKSYPCCIVGTPRSLWYCVTPLLLIW